VMLLFAKKSSISRTPMLYPLTASNMHTWCGCFLFLFWRNPRAFHSIMCP
jgi:hypothetical protein